MVSKYNTILMISYDYSNYTAVSWLTFPGVIKKSTKITVMEVMEKFYTEEILMQGITGIEIISIP